MTLISDHKYVSIGSVPISEDNPSGENIRYGAAFEQLEAELAKQESLNAETVDWQVVAKLSSEIIEKSSKDLLVGSYLCYALLMTERYAGLAVGLNILSEIVENHWEGLFPPLKRMRARQTAFVWLAEKAGTYLSAQAPGPNDSEAVLAAAAAIKLLDNQLVENMGDQAPMLSEIARPLKNYSQSALAAQEKIKQEVDKSAEMVEKTVSAVPDKGLTQDAEPVADGPSAKVEETETATIKPQPVPSQTPVAAKPVVQSEAVASAAGVENDADTKKILRQLQTTMRDISSFWINSKLSDPRPYRQARIAVWMVIENVPPDQGCTTQINPPAAERLKYFETQLGKKEYTQLVPELEKTLSRSPFWLNGHFLVVKALRQIGIENNDAVQTIIRELGNFLDRLPSVLQLSFSDNTPFADDQTRMWIESEVLISKSADGEGSAASVSDADEWSAALDAAKQLAAGGETDQAVALLSEGISSSEQLRDQFYWRCALADLYIQTGSIAVASAMLEQLLKQCDNLHVASWEPGLLAKVYRLLFQSYQKQKKLKKDDTSLDAKIDQVFEQLCWFDPIAASSVKGE